MDFRDTLPVSIAEIVHERRGITPDAALRQIQKPQQRLDTARPDRRSKSDL
jgi:plasmid maintenance system antidote protein VapI